MHSIKFSKIIALIFSGLIVASAQAQTPAPVAKVNGVAIPQARLDMAASARVSQGQPDSPELRKALRESLINEEILVQEAMKKGLDRTPEVATQLEMARQSVLVGAYMQDHVKNDTVSEEELRKEYEGLRGMLGDKEYNGRHIQVNTQEEAKDLITRIKKGAKFEKLAAEKSKDQSTKDNGGAFDWRNGGNLPRPFVDALAKLQKGKVAEDPVQTQAGWHVIRLDDVRPLKVPPLEEIKQGLQQRVNEKHFRNKVTDLRAKAKIE